MERCKVKISVKQFKTITKLDDLEIKPLTVISGENSGGKTSLIQLILLFKQTLEQRSIDFPLVLNKPYVSLGKYKDIVYGRDNKQLFEVAFSFSKEDIKSALSNAVRFLGYGPLKDILLKIQFSFSSERIYVQNYYLEYNFIKEKKIWLNLNRKRSTQYYISCNNPSFYDDTYIKLRRRSDLKSNIIESEIDDYFTDGMVEWETTVYFNRMFPESVKKLYCDLFNEEFSSLVDYHVEKLLSRFFSNMSYIGPLRDEPHNYYLNIDDTSTEIGIKGEHAIHILASQAKKEITYYKIKSSDEQGINFEEKTESLEDCVNYWLCSVFQLAKNIKVNKLENQSIYRVDITNNLGLKVPITHVGFGISQILPIIVEGLRLKPGSTLILEQPEIHLHPKVQSLLFDFLYSLTLSRKKIIIETHSDHFITRLRRRVAEDSHNQLAKEVLLIFVENESDSTNYKVLDLTDLGTLKYWPKNFFDQLDLDLKAIIKAQGRKRRNAYKIDRGE